MHSRGKLFNFSNGNFLVSGGIFSFKTGIPCGPESVYHVAVFLLIDGDTVRDKGRVELRVGVIVRRLGKRPRGQ